jgi:poly(3-hydroxybutyrate) depolymerase
VPAWPSTQIVTLAGVSDGSRTMTRHYGYYVPANLVTNDPSHPASAIFFLSGGGGSHEGSQLIDELADTKMIAQANADRFVVIVLMPPSIADRPNGSWQHPQTDCGGAGGVVGGGSCSSSPIPSDEGYIKAAVADATSRFGLDASRRWILGGSAGANMARDALCDSSSLFRGGMTMGGGANARYGTATGACPAGNKHVFYLELSGKNTQQDPYRTISIPSNCTSACDHTILGLDATRTWWSSYLGGCAAPVHTTTGSGVLSDVYDYSCSNVPTSSQFRAVAVTGGGHTWCNLDTAPDPHCNVASNPSGGWSTAAYTFAWFTSRQW